MNSNQIKQDWNSRGYSFGVSLDPPGQILADFVHRVDEMLVHTEGEIEIEIEGKPGWPEIGEKVFIPGMQSIRSGMSEGAITCGITDKKCVNSICRFIIKQYFAY